jgi:hypothetical protein
MNEGVKIDISSKVYRDSKWEKDNWSNSSPT